MGRPIPEKYMGNYANSGKQIRLEANFGSGVVDAWIVNETSNRSYRVTDGSNEMDGYIVKNSPNPGEVRLPVYKQGGATEYAWNVNYHTVKTFERGYYSWHFDAPDGTFVQLRNG